MVPPNHSIYADIAPHKFADDELDLKKSWDYSGSITHGCLEIRPTLHRSGSGWSIP